MSKPITQELLNLMAQYEIDRIMHQINPPMYIQEINGEYITIYPKATKPEEN